MKFIARQKYRFDIGQGFLAIINFAFIVLAAREKITTLLHLPEKMVIPILVPLALVSVWLIGWILDRCHFMEAYQTEQNRRNEMLKEMHAAMNDKADP
jgi:hypothetical protein